MEDRERPIGISILLLQLRLIAWPGLDMPTVLLGQLGRRGFFCIKKVRDQRWSSTNKRAAVNQTSIGFVNKN